MTDTRVRYRARRPKLVLRHGPYASARWDPQRGEWIVSLTDEGRQVAADFLIPYPVPAKLALTNRDTQTQARWFARTFGDDALRDVCLAAVADAVRLWDPTRVSAKGKTACLSTVVGWQIRAQLSKSADRELRRGLTRCQLRNIPNDERLLLVRSGHYGLRSGGSRHGESTDFDPFAVLPARSEPDPDAAEAIDRLCRHAGLSDRERWVIEQRMDRVTMTVIGARLGLSKERIRQIEIRTLERLREAAAELGYLEVLA